MTVQFSLLDLMAAPLDLSPVAVDDRDRTLNGEWDALCARSDAAVAAGEIEHLQWGNDMPTRAPSYHLDLFRDVAGWRYRSSYALGNCGGGGPWGCEQYRSRDAAVLTAFREKMRGLAHILSSTHGDDAKGRKQATDLAAWMIGQCAPEEFGGIDLAAEFADLCALAVERERRRCTAIFAAYGLKERVDEIMQAQGHFAYSGSCDHGLLMAKGADATTYPAQWAICGRAPDALSIVVYPNEGQEQNPVIALAVEAMREGAGVPVTVAAKGWTYPIARWEWEERVAA